MLTVWIKIYTIFLTGGHRMKRKDLLRKLKAAGLLFKEGGEHTRVYKGDIMITTVPRSHFIILEKI